MPPSFSRYFPWIRSVPILSYGGGRAWLAWRTNHFILVEFGLVRSYERKQTATADCNVVIATSRWPWSQGGLVSGSIHQSIISVEIIEEFVWSSYDDLPLGGHLFCCRSCASVVIFLYPGAGKLLPTSIFRMGSLWCRDLNGAYARGVVFSF